MEMGINELETTAFWQAEMGQRRSRNGRLKMNAKGLKWVWMRRRRIVNPHKVAYFPAQNSFSEGSAKEMC